MAGIIAAVDGAHDAVKLGLCLGGDGTRGPDGHDVDADHDDRGGEEPVERAGPRVALALDREGLGEEHREARDQDQQAALHHLVQTAKAGGVEIKA